MDLILLEMFCTVYRELSFSRAAELLNLTQPTVSIRIKELEEAVGTPLFNRLGREITPTDAGRFLYAEALPLLAQRQQLTAKMASFLNRIEGPLAVGTSSALGEHVLAGSLMSFQAAYPQVRIKLRFFGHSERTLEELRNGEIELGVVLAESVGEDMVAESFGTDQLVLVTPADAHWQERPRLSLSDLKSVPLIVLDTGSATRSSLEQALLAAGLRLSDLHIVAEIGRTAAIKEAVMQGYGVSFLSRRAVEPELESGTLRIAEVPELGRITRQFDIVHARRRELSPTGRACLKFLRERGSTHGVAQTSVPAAPNKKARTGR